MIAPTHTQNGSSMNSRSCASAYVPTMMSGTSAPAVPHSITRVRFLVSGSRDKGVQDE